VIRSYRELVVWQKAMDLLVDVYRDTRCFPSEERYGLTSQMRRAAVSIPSNIAEGQMRLTTGEFRQFLGNARGSLGELSTQIEASRRLGFLEPDKAGCLVLPCDEIGRMINGLLTSLRQR